MRSQARCLSARSQEIRSLRRKVIASIARRDPKLAEKLIRDDGLGDNIDDGNAATNIEVANSLVKTQPDKAVEFAERGLETGINTETVYFLLRLRRQSEPGADQLFANILARIAAQPFVDADTLLLLGTYVFTFPRSGSELRNLSSEGIRYVGVGPLLLVDISADRPNVSRSLVIGYLQVATEVVCRSVAQTQDRMKFYATGYLLLNKTERFTPELTPRIAMAMQALSQDVPNELKQESTYKNSEVRAPKDFDEITKELEKKEDVHYRDSLYLSLVSDLWQRSDYAKARIVNARISDMAVRDRLTSIIGFGEATTALKKGAVGEAEKMCVRLPQGIERALLRLGIAHMYADKGDLPRAAESINASLLDAAKLDDSRRPYLVLSAASQLVHVNAPAATATLLDAVRQFNALKDSTVDDNWDERVEVGMLWRDFPLEVEGVSHSFSQAMPDLMRADPDGTVGAVMGLTHEKHLSLALVEAAAVLLK